MFIFKNKLEENLKLKHENPNQEIIFNDKNVYKILSFEKIY